MPALAAYDIRFTHGLQVVTAVHRALDRDGLCPVVEGGASFLHAENFTGLRHSVCRNATAGQQPRVGVRPNSPSRAASPNRPKYN